MSEISNEIRSTKTIGVQGIVLDRQINVTRNVQEADRLGGGRIVVVKKHEFPLQLH